MHYPSRTGSTDLERRAYNLHHLQLSMMAAQRQGQATYRDGERHQDAPLTPPSSAPLSSEDEFTQDGWTVIAPAPGGRIDAYEREHQRQQIAQRALGLRPQHPSAPNTSATGPGTPAGRLSRQRSSIPHWEQWDTQSASANAMANWAQRLRSLQQYNSAVTAARTSIPPAPVTPADIRIHSSRSFTPPNQIDRTDRSQQENHTPAATHPSFRTKAVYELDCNYCGQHICKRGMKAILLADTTIELFSTDCIPSGRTQLLSPDYLTRNCHCRIRDVACLTCGNVIGYHVTQPCNKCMTACHNGHFWMFHEDAIKGTERADESGKRMIWAHLPGVERDDREISGIWLGWDGVCR